MQRFGFILCFELDFRLLSLTSPSRHPPSISALPTQVSSKSALVVSCRCIVVGPFRSHGGLLCPTFKILLRDVDGPPIPRGTVHPDPLVIGSTRIRMVERGCRPPRMRGGVGPIDGNHPTSEFELNVSSVAACDSNVAWR
jgi:hypothetical protein